MDGWNIIQDYWLYLSVIGVWMAGWRIRYVYESRISRLNDAEDDRTEEYKLHYRDRRAEIIREKQINLIQLWLVAILLILIGIFV